MSALGQIPCFNHPVREAAARCPSCSRYYCRECVTEHKGKILCTGCLQLQSASLPDAATGNRRSVWGLFLLFPPSFLALWFLFYLAGRILAAVPAPYHNGSFWSGMER